MSRGGARHATRGSALSGPRSGLPDSKYVLDGWHRRRMFVTFLSDFLGHDVPVRERDLSLVRNQLYDSEPYFRKDITC